MKAFADPVAGKWRWMLPVLFVAGFVVLVAMWATLYWAESLFTESHLVGYHCCVTEQDLPEPGMLERTLSDFFRTSPGKHLPSLLFVGANLGLFVLSLRRGGRHRWWLPWLFITFSTLYFLVDFQLVTVSWSIANRLVGPQTSAYKGYESTWYGIVLHLILWIAFFTMLSGVLWRLLSKPRAIEETG